MCQYAFMYNILDVFILLLEQSQLLFLERPQIHSLHNTLQDVAECQVQDQHVDDCFLEGLVWIWNQFKSFSQLIASIEDATC